MAFDIGVSFSVQTQELLNAKSALQSLVQTAKDLNTIQDKAAKSAESLVTANEKIADTAKQAAKATQEIDSATTRSEKGVKGLASESDSAASRLAKLKDQLSFLRDDLNLSEVGFTKSQAGVLAWAKSVGATSDVIREFASTFDNLNKVTGSNPFDQSSKGLSRLTQEMKELNQVQQLAAQNIGLTSDQIKMLSRDIESIVQQNQAFGRSAEEGVEKHRKAFIDAANSVNAYKEQVKQAQAESENLFRQELDLAKNRKLVNDELMKTWASGVGGKSEALSALAQQYAEEEKLAASHSTKLQQINATAGNAAADEYYRRQAAASKIASDAIDQLERDTRKLIITNELLDRGFTASSANALFKYREALEKTGISANELKQKLYTLEQDLMKRQNTSPFSKMREDIKKVTEQTNHLSRAISVQLGDVAISLAGGQNPFVVLLQQGDQIRGAVQQAVDAGQSINKAMAGAFTSMFTSFKLVGTVVKEFAMDGLRSVADSFEVVARHTARVNDVNKQFADGTISATRHSRLMQQAALQNAEALGTLRLVALGTAAAIAVTLVAAFVSLSKEQDAVAKVNAQFGASFGATSEEALNMARSMNDLGVNTATAISVMSGLMKAGSIGKEAFEGIALAASEAQKWVGISVEDTVKKFAELAKDPVKVLGEFTQQTGYLSQAQIQLVRDLREAGDEAKAQEVAIGLLKGGIESMTSQARQDMSALGRVITEITSTTDTMWDSFKKSAAVEVGLKAFKLVLDVVAVSVHAVYSVIRDVATGIALVIDIASNPTGNLTAKWDAFKESIIANGKAHDEFSKKVILGTKATEGLTAAERERNSSLQQVIGAVDKYTKAQETSVKSQVKTMQQSEYVAARVAEDIKKYTEGLTKTQREAFLQDERYQKARIEAEKTYAKEWQDAQSKSAPKSYKALRDNELQETKKFYEEQLKQLKDFETQQSKINKDAFESKAITYGQYVAREIELVASSQQKQLAIIEQSEAAYRENIDKRRKAQEAAASAAIKEGGSASKINEKLSQELKNLSNEARTAEEGFKGLRAALKNSANAKYAEFYKELSKAVFDSNEALKKFSQTVADNQRRRREDLVLQRRLADSYGAEAEAIKASASTMRSYEGAIEDSEKALEEATKRRQELEAEMSTVVGIEAYMQLAKKVEEAVDHEEKIRLNMIKTVSKAQKDSAQAGADAMVAYNIEVFKEIRNALSEDIYNALFEGGSKGAASLKAVLNKMFKNYVINVFLNPIMGQVTGAVSSALGLSGVSQAAGGVGGVGGLVNSASNLYSMFNSPLLSTNIAAGLSSQIGTLGADLWMNGFESVGNSMIEFSSSIAGAASTINMVGNGLGYVNALYNLSEGKLGSTAGAAIGTYFGGPIGSFIGSTLGGMVDGMFGGSPYYGGDAVSVGGAASWTGKKGGGYDSGVGNSFSSYAQGISTVLTGLLKDEILVKIGFDENEKRARAYLDIYDTAGSVAVTRSGVSVAKGEEGAKEAVQLVAKEAFTVLLADDRLANYEKQLLATASAAGATYENLVSAYTQIVAVNAGFSNLSKAMAMFVGISDDMKAALLQVFGSIEGVSEAAGSFYQNFYSEEERLKAAGDNMNSTLKSLGLSIDVFAGDTAKANFRKAVEEAFSANNTGLASALLAISGSFAEVADAAQAAADAAQEAGEATSGFAKEMSFDKGAASALQAAYNSMQSAESLLSKIAIGNGPNSALLKEQRLWAAITTATYQDQITLAGELTDLVLERSMIEQENAKRMIDFGKSLVKYVESLKIGNLSPLTTGQKLAEAQKQYVETLRKAQAGDEDAMQALQGASSAYLDLARTYFASSEDYTSIFNSVTGSLESLGISSQTDAQKQLEVSSQNLSELKKLESIVSGAYAKAKTDFDVQKNLLQLQIDQMLRTANGIEAVRDILGSLSPELSGQINSGGALGKSGGVGASSFDTLAKQYVDILGSKSPTQDFGYISAYMSNLDYAKLAEEYNNAYALLQDDASRSKLLVLFQNLAKLNNIPIDGSHRSGLDNVPFNGYVAELHKGERVLTATENRSYGASMVGTNSALIAEVRMLRQEVAILRSENREDAKMQASVTARASELNAKTVVEGVGEAASKETYSNNLGAKLR